MATDTDPGDDRFETIDWENVHTGVALPRPRTLSFVAALGCIGALFCYDLFVVQGGPTIEVGPLRWDFTSLDWLFVLSWLVLVTFVFVPLARNRRRTIGYWRRLRTNRLAVGSLLYLVVFVVLGTVGSLLLGEPRTNVLYSFQPPVFTSVPTGSIAQNCAGSISGTDFASRCHGSFRFPFGTTRSGQDVLKLVVAGMRVALQVGLITATLIIPIATTVGVVAGYLGGVVDEVLMRYVDVQQTVPAFLVYVILTFLFDESLFLVIVVFGLLSWGGVARLVRSEALQRREEGYVLAAESAGVSRWRIIGRHVLPNVSNTVVAATTRGISTLILIEAALAYLQLSQTALPSWGATIANGLRTDYFPTVWWTWVVPAVFLAATVVALSVFGDALRDVLDPRGAS